MKFYICEHCKNIITFADPSGVPVMCCGQKMTELVPGSVDAAVEKHVPEVTVDGNKVSVVVGSVIHPMTEAHYIKFIAIQTKQRTQLKSLTPTDEPKAEFALADGDELVEAYAYCNLHGLWKK